MSCISLAKIADYLECSVDYLLGRSADPSMPQAESSIQKRYDQLDAFDQGRIQGILDEMLQAEKYQHKS